MKLVDFYKRLTDIMQDQKDSDIEIFIQGDRAGGDQYNLYEIEDFDLGPDLQVDAEDGKEIFVIHIDEMNPKSYADYYNKAEYEENDDEDFEEDEFDEFDEDYGIHEALKELNEEDEEKVEVN